MLTEYAAFLLRLAIGAARDRIRGSRTVDAHARVTRASDLVGFAHGMECGDVPLQVSAGRLTGLVARVQFAGIDLCYEICNQQLVFPVPAVYAGACIHPTGAVDRVDLLGGGNLISAAAGQETACLFANGVTDEAQWRTLALWPQAVPTQAEFWNAIHEIIDRVAHAGVGQIEELDVELSGSHVATVLDTFASRLPAYGESSEWRKNAALLGLLSLVVARTTFKIQELAEDLRMSRRSLHNYTTEQVGVGPKMLVKSLGLRNTMFAISESVVSGKPIGDLAFEHGFQNFSQFCSDYRRMFGERPSDTLKRYASPAAGRQTRSPRARLPKPLQL